MGSRWARPALGRRWSVAEERPQGQAPLLLSCLGALGGGSKIGLQELGLSFSMVNG